MKPSSKQAAWGRLASLRAILIFPSILAIVFSLGLTAYAAGTATVGSARFTVITPQCIRMEYSPSCKFVDSPSYFAVNRDSRFGGAKIRSSKNSLEISTGVIKLTYTPDGKPFSSHNLSALIKGKIQWVPGMQNRENLRGAYRTLDGCDGFIKTDDGVISRDGWYLLDDSRGPLFGNGWLVSRPSDAGTDWYLFGYGNDYKSALKSLTAIGGEIPLPRRYAFGTWYSRFWPYTSAEYRQIIKEYSDHDFPLDVIVMDMDWHKDGWTGWSWNRNLLPDAEDLLKWFHAQGLAVTLNVHPAEGVRPHEDMYSDFMSAIDAQTADKNTVPFDAGDKHYLDTLFKYTHNPLEAEGVDFWWLDWQQYEVTRSVADLTNLQSLNEYYFSHTSADDKRGLSFSRWAGWGDHRHPIHFSGDASTHWKMLAFEVPFTSTSSNSGCFFWTHDIGGHMAGRNEESYTRWCQFGAFTAALRSHSTRDASMDRRPWKYSKWAEDSMRISFHIRSLFFPYTYSSARESCMQTVPLIRPMYIEYPDEEAAYSQPQEYLYGDSILVAPVAEAGIGTSRLARQVVWFPRGNWYNYFTGERFSDHREHLVTADINEFPLYIRGGVPVPMQPYAPRMGTQQTKELVVRCYPGEDGKIGKFDLYEDDGITNAYKGGSFSTTRLSYIRNSDRVAVAIDPAKGSFGNQLTERSYRIELPCTLPATAVTVDGRSAKSEYDYVSHTNVVRIAAVSIRKGCKVKIQVEEAPADETSIQAFASRVGLPPPAAGSSKEQLLSTALDTCKDLNGTIILASAGVGSFEKITSPFGDPYTKTPRNYTSADIKASIISDSRTSDDGMRIVHTQAEVFGCKFSSEYDAGLDIKGLQERNVAPSAKVSFSSSELPEAVGLTDGVADGYPALRENEWASANEKAGAWARLEWNQPQTIDRVLLFDRPNLNDQVTGGILEFSDGTKVEVGELKNDASRGTAVSFPSKTVTWLKFTVTKTSPGTQNVGLSEMIVLKAR